MDENVDSIHKKSLQVGVTFAMNYSMNPSSEETKFLLEEYKRLRRLLPKNDFGNRYQASEAYHATQGYLN